MGAFGVQLLWDGGREAAKRIVHTWRLAILLECASDCISTVQQERAGKIGQDRARQGRAGQEGQGRKDKAKARQRQIPSSAAKDQN